jgi:hypothetical protein
VGRTALTLVGIAALAVAAVFIAQRMLQPTQEKVEQGQKVLTQAYRPKLLECYVLEDAEVPAGLPRPDVSEDLLYLAVLVLYPGVDRAPPGDHRFAAVNGGEGTLDPADVATEADDEGTTMTLVFKVDSSFEFARLVRGEEVLFDRVALP